MKVKQNHVTSFDGTRIWYISYGEGIPLIACNGIGCDTSYWRYFAKHFKDRYQVILWDYRGHGNSDLPKDVDSTTIDNNARDMAAVLDDLGIDKATLFGHSMGTQVIFEFYRLFPERVLGLVPILGSYGRPFDTFLGTDLMKHAFPYIYSFGTAFEPYIKMFWKPLIDSPLAYPIAALTRNIHPTLNSKDKMEPYFHHIAGMDLNIFLNMMKHMQDHDASDVLPGIVVPTLIIAGENDTFTPVWLSAKMNEMIPDSEMLMLREGSHAALIEQSELMHLRIEKYLTEKIDKPVKKTAMRRTKAGSAEPKTSGKRVPPKNTSAEVPPL